MPSAPRRGFERGENAKRRDEAADLRDAAARLRDQAAERRDPVADLGEGSGGPVDADSAGRDRALDWRDFAADRRYRAADRRDRQAEQTEAATDDGDVPSDGSDAVEARQEAAADRRGAGQDRAASAKERTETGRDRVASGEDRTASASDRALSAVDRRAASEDRTVSTQEIHAASLDSLTGAYVRGAGLAELERDLSRAKRAGHPFTVAFVDVDGLKQVNDGEGHNAGDSLLLAVVRALRENLRSYDLIVRYGGDEFVCAISGSTMTDVAVRMAHVNGKLEGYPDGHRSVTVGLAEAKAKDSVQSLIARADAALYKERSRRPAAR